MSKSTKSSVFFECFVIAQCFCWSPFKLLAYISPFICLGWYIIRTNSGKTVIRFFSILILYLVLIAVYTIFYATLYGSYFVSSSILTIITYGSFIFLLSIADKDLFNITIYLKYVRFAKIIIFIQSAIGIIQLTAAMIVRKTGFDGSAGDMVQGTINFFSLSDNPNSFSNVMYATNMAALLLLITPYILFYRRGWLIYFLGAFSVMLASVLHILISLIISVVLVLLYFRKRLIVVSLKSVYIATFLLVILLGLYLTQPQNFSLVGSYLKIYSKLESPKTMITIDAIRKIPERYAMSPIIGLGPGQFSSRAGLISTGRYLGSFNNPRKLDFLPNKFSEPARIYLLPVWTLYANNPQTYGNSAMAAPYFSLLAIYSEFGILVFIAVVYIVFRWISFSKRTYLSSEHDMLKKNIALACAIGILFIFIISFFENYLEITQAIFPGLIILKFLYSSSYSNGS